MVQNRSEQGIPIKFNFTPYNYESLQHTIEKSENGKKKRYLCGISSGLKWDGHGERMSEKAIQSFHDQANSGEVLLYASIHGIKDVEDIGILTKSEILPDGDWYTEYRLYDEDDGVGSHKLEVIDTLWKQINGLPPYTKPRQKGFSVEGYIPTDSVGTNPFQKKIMENVLLDGVVLVPRPAYSSIATAVYKAFGETTPERANSLQGMIRAAAESKNIENEYYRLKWEYSDALEKAVEQIMSRINNNKAEELGIVFDEYKGLMVELILNSQSVFEDFQVPIIVDEIASLTTAEQTVHPADLSRAEVFRSLLVNFQKLRKSMEDRLQ